MRAQTRALVAFFVGVVVGVALTPVAPWQVALLAGWSAAAVTVVASTLHRVWGLDAAETAAHATVEDDSRALADVLVLSAATVSLAAIGLTLVKASRAHGPGKAAIVTVAAVAVAAGWAVVQTVYTLRYARIYFAEGGGLQFGGDETPDYHDFAYVAVTIGMTFQVSDTGVDTRAMRRAVTRHALTSYVFGTIVVAMAINVVAGLLKS